MTFALKKIVVYSHAGDIRELSFNLSGLNVITGASKTGKSSIIDIIDFCTGRGECNVAEGVIRNTASWFAVLLNKSNEEIYIARKNPGPGIRTSGEIFFVTGKNIATPPLAELKANITRDSLLSLLTRFCGISENEHRPASGTRPPLQATISHAKLFCFQKQYEIANQRVLFHRQGEDFMPQAIKDTIPYFLGAVDEQFFLRQHLLDQAIESLRIIEEEEARHRAVRATLLPKMGSVISEAKRAGLVEQQYEPIDLENAVTRLTDISKARADSPGFLPDYGDSLEKFRNEANALSERLAVIKEDIRAARLFASDQSGFLKESSEQMGRLSALELFKESTQTGDTCPLCFSQLPSPTPKLIELHASLNKLQEEISSVQRDNPHLQKRIDDLEKTKAAIEQSFLENQRLFTVTLSENEKAHAQHDLITARARTIGRISAFLETVRPDGNAKADYETRIAAARLRAKGLEDSLNLDEVHQRVDTFLNLISRRMSEYSESLELEHSGSVLRLDIKKPDDSCRHR